MHNLLAKSFRPVFYATLPVFLIMYFYRLARGNYISLLPIFIGLAAFTAIFWQQSWALVAVRAWAVLFMLVGAFLWLAVLLGGASHLHSALFAAVCTVMLALGVYFWSYSKHALQRSGGAS